MKKPTNPIDKSVFDIKIAANRTKDWLTLAVSADSSLADLHLGILGALEFKGSFWELENVYRFTMGATVYENGRGSRTPLRRLLAPNDVIAYSCDPVGLALTCTVESRYEVETRRPYPKVISDSDGSKGTNLRRATSVAQYAMSKEYRHDEPRVSKRGPAREERLSVANEHGFLTAIAIGPMVMPSAWLGRFMSETVEIDDARSLLERVMSRYNDINKAANARPDVVGEQYVEIFAADSDGAALRDWASGFVDAMSICGDEWIASAKDAEFKRAMGPIMAVVEISSSGEKREWLKDESFRHDLVKALGIGVGLVAEMVRAKLATGIAGTIRRATPKRSPNAPCVCGSGKKQKRCCGV